MVLYTSSSSHQLASVTMFKQDFLNCFYSKVRWFAIHQRKKVTFQINPNCER